MQRDTDEKIEKSILEKNIFYLDIKIITLLKIQTYHFEKQVNSSLITIAKGNNES